MIDVPLHQACAAALLVAAAAVTLPAPRERAAATTEGNDPPVERLLTSIRRHARETEEWTGRGEIDERVMNAIRDVPRDRFVPPGSRRYAWENRPLAIGHGQTISQPFIVALMTDLLALEPDDRVLEVGTGSGYQAAVLARLAAEVYTIEIVDALAESARARLAELGYDNVHVRAGDGFHGWPEAAPFDAVIVTAVGETVPPPLLEQLADGGRMVLPIGPRDGAQELVLVEKRADGVAMRSVLPVQFVPLTRKD